MSIHIKLYFKYLLLINFLKLKLIKRKDKYFFILNIHKDLLLHFLKLFVRNNQFLK